MLTNEERQINHRLYATRWRHKVAQEDPERFAKLKRKHADLMKKTRQIKKDALLKSKLEETKDMPDSENA